MITTIRTMGEQEAANKAYEETLTLSQWQELQRLRNREREFAKNVGYDFSYGRYWEVMTLEELREVQQ
jgi:hypothetical protein